MMLHALAPLALAASRLAARPAEPAALPANRWVKIREAKVGGRAWST